MDGTERTVESMPMGQAAPPVEATAPLLLRGTEEHAGRARLVDVAGGRAAALVVAAPEPERTCEDAALVVPVGAERAILAVADGVGGRREGAEAAQLVVGLLAAAAGRADGAELPLRGVILDAIERANEELQRRGTGAAATLVVVEIDGTTARTYHVGDAAALVVGQRGRLKLQTVAHSPVGYAVEAGVLDGDAAVHHEDLHIVSNLVGAPDMRIELGPTLELAPHDTVVLGSDGLFDNLYLDELVARVRCGPIRQAAEQAAALARARMIEPVEGMPSKPDDLSLVLFRRTPTRRGASR
ncbi:MAG: serine/threonine protein phosphatase [Acidobacteria bacterium]|nr:MAG: serine/threonine protein phosphatase [Acidobacteriota bacterium]